MFCFKSNLVTLLCIYRLAHVSELPLLAVYGLKGLMEHFEEFSVAVVQYP